METGDFNNDQFPDIVVSSEQDSSVTILLGNGKGQFSPANGSPFPAGNIANDIAVGDFNNDGNADLGFANHDRKYLTVLLGNGKGQFTPAEKSPFRVESIPHVHGIATGDFNHDGRLDLVTDSWGNNQVAILFGEAVSGFITPAKFFNVGKMPYQRLRTADINRDGNTDIVTTNLGGNNTTILLGNGKGGFNEAAGSPFPCGDAPFNLAIGDVNADGNLDLAIVNSPSSTGGISTGTNGLTILLGDGTGKFNMVKGSPYPAGKIPNRVAIGDVDGDGVQDIVTSDSDSDTVYLFKMGKNGSVQSQTALKTGNHPKGVVIVDINGDGKGDIVVCNNADNDILIISGR